MRWRPRSDARQRTGYLPSLALLAEYTAYEHSCWNEDLEAEAPEDRYPIRTGADDDPAARVAPRAPQPPSANLEQWVGVLDHGEPQLGPFFRTSTKTHGDQNELEHVHLVRRLARQLRTTPMDELTYDDYLTQFQKWMACSACVARCQASGQSPGRDVPWAELVPRSDRTAWDDRTCPEHQTDWSRRTYEARQHKLAAHFTATRTPEAGAVEDLHVPPLTSPVPRCPQLLKNVIFKGAENEADELRFGFRYQQVLDLVAASPERLRPLPLVAAWCLSRGGQEMFGTRIGDFLPENPHAVHDVNAPKCAAMIKVRNFRVRRARKVAGKDRYFNRSYGKNEGAARDCPLPAEATTMLIGHIREFRSKPSSSCLACCDGHRHWATDDHDNNPHTGCDFDADAPLWADDDGQWYRPDYYSRHVWPEICRRAHLTKETLGWKPLPRHARSTGTTLYMEQPEPNVALVMRLGGWKDEQTLRRHYEKHRHDVLIAAAQATEDANQPHPADAASSRLHHLEQELRRLESENRRLAGKLIEAGLDPNPRIIPLQHDRQRGGVWADTNRVMAAIQDAVLVEGKGQNRVLELLDLAAAQKNYASCLRFFERHGLPPIPRNHAQRSADRRRPYEQALRTAFDPHRTETG